MKYIALYNTYDKLKFREGHRRAIVRAATLAYSFDFDLILVNFPEISSIPEMIKICTLRSTVGERGLYLRKLGEEKRIHIHKEVSYGFLPQYMPTIATTSKPDVHKKIHTKDIAKMYINNEKFTLIFGLGHKGLEREVLDRAVYHYEVTDRERDLETCVALGCVIGKIVGFVESIKESTLSGGKSLTKKTKN